MLIAKIYINNKQIDEIYIHNIGKTHPGVRRIENTAYNYKIRKPENIDKIIVHNRNDGYEPLLIKALNEIEKLKKPK